MVQPVRVSFQSEDESLFLYHTVCTMRKVLLQYDTFKVRDSVVGFVGGV